MADITNNQDTLSVTQINCNSLNPKVAQFKEKLIEKQPDLVLLSETWIKDDRFIPRFINYNGIWKHRPRAEAGGGLGILVKEGLPFKRSDHIVDYQTGCLEALGIQIQSS